MLSRISPSRFVSRLFFRRAMSSSSASSVPIRMDPFCLKQFQPSAGTAGQHIAIPCTPDEFVRKTNEVSQEQDDTHAGSTRKKLVLVLSLMCHFCCWLLILLLCCSFTLLFSLRD